MGGLCHSIFHFSTHPVTMNHLSIRMATPSDVRALSSLFDDYRRFYQQPSDIERAIDFISERLNRHDSWILVAESHGVLSGFCQLFPSFSSTRTCRIAILNDLYVTPQARKDGVGKALMLAAEELARNHGLGGLELATGMLNTDAQRLYEKLGWQRDTEFYYYSKSLRS
jgi:GNAT superfamily N-acetyltransferase